MSNYGLDIIDNPALGLFFGSSAEKEATNMTGIQDITLMLSPGEFNSDRLKTFVTRICRYAKKNRVGVLGGTEATANPNNPTHQLLKTIAPRYGFHVTANPHGEWILCNKLFGTVLDARFIPVIPAEGRTPGHIGHSLRGIVTNHIRPHQPIGDVFVGVSHYLAGHVEGRDVQNQKLERAIGDWAKQVGTGNSLVFHMGDTNYDDKTRNVYQGAPMQTCWDELDKWPVTHPHANGKGPTLDVISRMKNPRVRCKSARALNDSVLPLPVDHFSVIATYAIQPVKEEKK